MPSLDGCTSWHIGLEGYLELAFLVVALHVSKFDPKP